LCLKYLDENMKKIIFIGLIIFALILSACTVPTNKTTKDSIEITELTQEETSQGIQVANDGTKYLIDPSKILSGGPSKDGIPSIDAPTFVTVEEADEWIQDNELVLALIHKNIKRVYPLQILVWHEIVNDKIEGDPILITYCPLCGSGIAYEPYITVNEEKIFSEFGTSGKLYNSNLIMYDRETDTYWSQIDGKAIVGELTGQELQDVSIDTVVWRDWKVEHPDSQVLSQETGFNRNYGKDPYGSYYEDSNLFFPVENSDDRIHSKDVIFGIEIEGEHKAYRENDVINQNGRIKDTFGEVDLVVERDAAGIVTITNQDTGEIIIKERDFWFAWYAFHPDTLLYGFDEEGNIIE
jgi:hypothetical protein